MEEKIKDYILKQYVSIGNLHDILNNIKWKKLLEEVVSMFRT